MHSQELDRALVVAENHSPEDVNDVLEAQARRALAVNDLTTFEALMLRAQRAELVVQHYKVYINYYVTISLKSNTYAEMYVYQ
jgi:intraflagellar transport protein 172